MEFRPQPWNDTTMITLSRHIALSSPGLGGRLSSSKNVESVATWPRTGSKPADLFADEALSPAQAAAALVVFGLESGEGLGPPLMTESARSKEFRPFLSAQVWADPSITRTRAKGLALAAGLLQIFDYWDESHEAAQAAGDLGEKPWSACWHAICHRREPDPGNAGYWLAQSRGNPVGQRLAELIEPSLEGLDPSTRAVASRLVRDGRFQDKAMVELCCRPRPPDAEKRLLRQVQKLEMALLVGAMLEELD